MPEPWLERIAAAKAAPLVTFARLLVCAMPALFVIGKAPPDIALSLVAILFLVSSGLTKNWAWLRTPWIVVALFIWFYLILVSFAAEDVEHSFGRAIPWIRFVVFAAALQHWVITDEIWRKRLLFCTGAVLAFVAADTFYQFFLGVDIFGIPTYEADSRLTGPMHELPPKVGMFMTRLMYPVLIAVIGWAVLVRRDAGATVIAILVICVGLSAVLITGERSALLLALFGLVLSVLILPEMRRLLIAAILVIGLVASGIAGASKTVYTRSFESTAQIIVDLGESHYGQIWLSSLRMAKAHPLFGVGLKNFRSACPNGMYGEVIDGPDGPLYKEAYGPTLAPALRCSLHPHNIYLEWLTEAGGIGLLGFLCLIGLWMRHFFARAETWRREPAAAGTVIGVLIFLWPFVSTMSFFTNWHGALFWFILGWALAATSIASEPRPATWTTS